MASLRVWQWVLLGGTAMCLCITGYEVGAVVRSNSARSRGRTEGWRSFPFEFGITQQGRRTHEAQQAEMSAANLRPNQFKEGSGTYIATYCQFGNLLGLCGSDSLLQTKLRMLTELTVGSMLMMTGARSSERHNMQTVDRVLESAWRPRFSIGTKALPSRWYSVSTDGTLHRSR